jgi:hypothetical protein
MFEILFFSIFNVMARQNPDRLPSLKDTLRKKETEEK